MQVPAKGCCSAGKPRRITCKLLIAMSFKFGQGLSHITMPVVNQEMIKHQVNYDSGVATKGWLKSLLCLDDKRMSVCKRIDLSMKANAINPER